VLVLNLRFLSELILHIETATKVCSVCLSQEGKVLNSLEREPEDYIHGEYLTLFIQEVLGKSQKTLKQLDAVSVSIGPGSYTGLRIGLAVAKGICYGLNIPILSIETLDSLLETGRKKYAKNTLCAVLDARRMEVYSKIISGQGDFLSDSSATIVDEKTFSHLDPLVCFGDGAEKLSELWSNRSVTIDNEIKISALGQVRLALKKYRDKDFEELAYLKPMYLKEFKIG
jgi:tRNA threonylcarbamoyladenosine biosynthesis protein TsaB